MKHFDKSVFTHECQSCSNCKYWSNLVILIQLQVVLPIFRQERLRKKNISSVRRRTNVESNS